MKKTVQIATIPLSKLDYSENDIIYEVTGNYLIATKQKEFGSWQPQQLLVLSDDKIQVEDFIYRTNELEVANDEWNGNKHHQWKKVIASYPQLPNILPISKETIQQWIDSGTPGEGIVSEEIYITSKKLFVNTQGNLLLEFDKQYKNTGNDLSDLAERAIDKIIANATTKPSIPTDEEIEEKAKQYCKTNKLEKRLWYFITKNYKTGYLQALKDLGL